MYILLSLAVVAILLLANELLWRHYDGHSEHHRKLVHILVGSFVAFWPFYLSWNDIRIISALFLVGVALSKSLNIFASIHEVERFSVGEISFALAVGALTFITKSDWIYTACLLQMSIADGLAAIVGIQLGKTNSYRVFNAKKSIAGTLTFLIVSLIILFSIKLFADPSIATGAALLAAGAATIVENIAVYGLDDLFIPVVVGIILTRW